MIVMPVAIPRLPANEVRRIVDAARPYIPRHLRVGTDGTCAGYHPTCHPRSDDFFRRDTLLDPLLQRSAGPMYWARRGGSAAMPDIGQQEESDKFLRFVCMTSAMTESGPNFCCSNRWCPPVWQWVGEAMPHDHLAATFLEGGQVRVFRVVDEPGVSPSNFLLSENLTSLSNLKVKKS